MAQALAGQTFDAVLVHDEGKPAGVLTRQDLLDFHKRTVHPNNIIISFIGDFDSAAMERRLRQAFESWPRGPQVAKPDPAITAANRHFWCGGADGRRSIRQEATKLVGRDAIEVLPEAPCLDSRLLRPVPHGAIAWPHRIQHGILR